MKLVITAYLLLVFYVISILMIFISASFGASLNYTDVGYEMKTTTHTQIILFLLLFVPSITLLLLRIKRTQKYIHIIAILIGLIAFSISTLTFTYDIRENYRLKHVQIESVIQRMSPELTYFSTLLQSIHYDETQKAIEIEFKVNKKGLIEFYEQKKFNEHNMDHVLRQHMSADTSDIMYYLWSRSRVQEKVVVRLFWDNELISVSESNKIGEIKNSPYDSLFFKKDVSGKLIMSYRLSDLTEGKIVVTGG